MQKEMAQTTKQSAGRSVRCDAQYERSRVAASSEKATTSCALFFEELSRPDRGVGLLVRHLQNAILTNEYTS